MKMTHIFAYRNFKFKKKIIYGFTYFHIKFAFYVT